MREPAALEAAAATSLVLGSHVVASDADLGVLRPVSSLRARWTS